MLAVELGQQQQRQDLAVALLLVLGKQQRSRLLGMQRLCCLPLSLLRPLGLQLLQFSLVLQRLPAHQPGQSWLLWQVAAVQQPLLLLAPLLVVGVGQLHWPPSLAQTPPLLLLLLLSQAA